LRWLEEVDLIVVRDRRFYFVDPVLRVWMRIYSRGMPPGEDDIRREVFAYLEGLTPFPTAVAEDREPAFTLPAREREEFID
jgi:hypothetical protein